MKVLINLPEETLKELKSLAKKRGWSRKQFMEVKLTSIALASKTKNNSPKD